MSAPVPAHADAPIIAAWERRKVALSDLAALASSLAPGTGYTPEEQELFAIVDRAEATIKETPAETVVGVELKIWAGLSHIMNNRDEETAINAADIDWFIRDETRFDWGERIILSAIESLREMIPPPNNWDVLKWLDRFEAVGGTLDYMTIGVQLHGRSIEDQQTARALLAELDVDPARKEDVRRLASANAPSARAATEGAA